jgi:chromosome segregation ATPase
LFITGAIYVYSTHQQSQLQKQELDFYINQLEESSLKRLALEKEIKQLSNELNAAIRQFNTQARELQDSKELIDPEYEQLENKIRIEIAEEYKQQQEYVEDVPGKVSLIRQLSALNPENLNSLISVNAQYSEFINSLNVSDERLEEVITALSNMTELQSQAMQDLMSQRFSQNLSRRDLRAQMVTINSPERIREVLSYELTDYELDAFTEFQQNQPSGRQGIIGEVRSGTATATAIRGPQGFFIESGDVPVLIESIEAIEITR